MTTASVNPIAGKYIKSLIDEQSPWDVACDCVDFPVFVKELHWYDAEGKLQVAEGNSPTGRDKKYYGVVVDRDRTGELSTIATVTGLYGTVPPAEAYLNLRDALASTGHQASPTRLYVSGDGGQQMLLVMLDGMKSPTLKDDIRMSIKLVTSLDGTKKHHCRLTAYNLDTGTEMFGIQNQEYSLSVKHTKAIGEKTIAFDSVIAESVKAWNVHIMPFLNLMCDAKFDKNVANEFLRTVLEQAKIPERHIDKCRTFYAGNGVIARDDGHSVYRVMSGISQYFNNEMGDDKVSRLESFQDSIYKRSRALIETTIAKFTNQA